MMIMAMRHSKSIWNHWHMRGALEEVPPEQWITHKDYAGDSPIVIATLGPARRFLTRMHDPSFMQCCGRWRWRWDTTRWWRW